MGLRKGLLVILCVCAGGFLPAALFAHGALIEHAPAAGIRIQAKYDNGRPMSGAQVVVYAPDNPLTPWLSGICDDEGRFSFVPDADLSGTWSVQARLAGHGAMLHIPLAPAAPEDRRPVPRQGYSAGQRWLMALSTVWGCVGTALYFKRRRTV